MESPPVARDPLSRGFVVVLVGAVLLEIAYMFLFSPFVTDDAAAHIGSAAGLVDSIAGFDLGDRFLKWNPMPVPSVLANALLAAFLPVVGVEWGERLVLIVYVCALPGSTLYAVRSMRPGWTWLACFAIPLTFSFSFLYGFWNFVYSVVAFLVTAGFVLRSPARITSGRTAALAALLLLAYFSHLVGYAVACLFVVVVLATRGLFRAEIRGHLARHGLAALLPSGALAVAYVVSSNSAEATAWSSPLRKLEGAVTLEWGLVTYDRLEVIFCLAAASALGLLLLTAALRRWPWHERDPDTLAVGAFTVITTLVAVFAPDAVGSGGSFISQRLVLFPAFGALIWLAGQELPRTYVLAASGVALTAAVGLAVVRYDELRQVERIARDFEPVVGCVVDAGTIVQGNLARVHFGSAGRIDPMTAEAGRLSAAIHGLDLGNVDFRIAQWVERFRHKTNPERHLFNHEFVEAVPPPLDFAAFEQATGDPVDYVVLWARPEMSQETMASGAWRRFDQSLRDRYRLALRSPEEWWELWIPRDRPTRLDDDPECAQAFQ